MNDFRFAVRQLCKSHAARGAANGIGRDYRPLLSLAAGRVLAQILYQVSPSDPSGLVASGTMLAAAALLACFFPARRATYVEPLQALRTE